MPRVGQGNHSFQMDEMERLSFEQGRACQVGASLCTCDLPVLLPECFCMLVHRVIERVGQNIAAC